MTTILKSCKVPWGVSPSMSGLTLTHGESDVQSTCSVVLGAFVKDDVGNVLSRRVEITFKGADYARVGPHGDGDGVEKMGYEIDGELIASVKVDEFLDWHNTRWQKTGYCPDSNFYIAVKSDWLSSLKLHGNYRPSHYIIWGRDGHIEIIAESYEWKEWNWETGHREAITDKSAVLRQGCSATD